LGWHKFRVAIPAFDASLEVESLMDQQEFANPGGSVYEGVAKASGSFLGREVQGTAWNEQNIGGTTSNLTPLKGFPLPTSRAR
jgi:hypothetical protein